MTNANIDEYAAARQNIFFTANGETPADGDLTGQCVTLLKWFFQDMCDGFPNPFAARGDARYVGKRLVAQGLAEEVPYADRQPGDVVCYEFGTYGHIAGQLSGGRVFEQNVGWSGVASRIVGGSYVYASRIGSENEQWRSDKNPHVYRLKSYNGDIMQKPAPSEVTTVFEAYLQAKPTPEQMQYYLARDSRDLYTDVLLATRPSSQEVVDAFNDLQGSAPDEGQKAYYVQYGRSVLYKDLGYAVDRMFEQYKKEHSGTGETLPAGTYLKINKADIKEIK